MILAHLLKRWRDWRAAQQERERADYKAQRDAGFARWRKP